jgi:RNA polymerase sigma factor (sigma-70 family)
MTDIARQPPAEPNRIAAAVDWEASFLEHLPTIERVIRYASRRLGLRDVDHQDFASGVKLRLLEDNYSVLRQFAGASRFETYLTTVVLNLARDFRIQKWGRWRPSAAAMRLGPLAVQLDTLIHRDGKTRSEAIETLVAQLGPSNSRSTLAELADQLPVRVRRRVEEETVLEEIPSEARSDQELLDRDRARSLDLAASALSKGLAALTPEDRLLIKLHFADGLTIAAIARVVGSLQRSLYSRLQKILAGLRQTMRDAGVDPIQVLEAVDWTGSVFTVDYSGGSEESSVRLTSLRGSEPRSDS